VDEDSSSKVSDKVEKKFDKPYPWTIHILPHSHDDVGWNKNINQYFDGSRRDIQWSNVRSELTSVVDALLRDPRRKFSEVEMKFFSMWFNE